MTLTVCVGSSGSGKTTFLNDVHKSHRCTYIRQYHLMRPYIKVSKIPNFDPTKLPYWNIYVQEEKDQSILTGGTMAGRFTPGLSGGQRKLLLFELIYQRTMDQRDLLIVLDEPFAGVTDDFIPFVVGRLNEMREKHNILLVTNDHVGTLTQMADNTITVSAIDRTVVKINDRVGIDREKAIMALSVGDNYNYKASSGDLLFFFDVEVRSNSVLIGIAIFSAVCNGLFIATFWDSAKQNAALVLIASGLITFFCVNPYMVATVEWRNSMVEEAEALMHASEKLNRILKALLTFLLIFLITTFQFIVVNVVVDGLGHTRFWIAMVADLFSAVVPIVTLGLYTKLPFAGVQLFGSIPFLMMIFFSTTYSPGAGIPVMKEFRYLFPRFYFWCMVPVVKHQMEGCPERAINTFYMVLSSFLWLAFFIVYQVLRAVKKSFRQMEVKTKRASMVDNEFYSLQHELYGKTMLSSNVSTRNVTKRDLESQLISTGEDGGHCDDLEGTSDKRGALLNLRAALLNGGGEKAGVTHSSRTNSTAATAVLSPTTSIVAYSNLKRLGSSRSEIDFGTPYGSAYSTPPTDDDEPDTEVESEYSA